jgi:hypothetical protein
MPGGFTSIGEVSMSCRDCPLASVISALQVRASEVGGEALVNRICDVDLVRASVFDPVRHFSKSISCRATVARRR